MIVSSAIGWALLSLVCAGANDLVFKKQASGGCGGRGMYMAVVGAVWLGVFAAMALIVDHATLTRSAITWGVIAGALSVAANYLLIWSFHALDASIGATIYRLNMVLAAVIAVVFLSEPMTSLKAMGWALGVGAIVCFAPSSKTQVHAMTRWALAAAIAASALRALMGIAYKLAANEFSALDVSLGSQQAWFLAMQGAMWIAVGTVAGLRFERRATMTGRDVRYGAVSGLLICGIVLFFAKALAAGQASVVIPIAQMSFLVTAVISWPVLKERFTMRKIIGLISATAAIVVLSLRA